MSPEEIRESLFECALALFHSEGYDETSISRLTRETGVAKGTFFNHFPTKDHILADFMAEVWAESVVESDGEGYRGTDAIIHVLDGVARRLEANPSIAQIVSTRLPALPLPDRMADEADTAPGDSTARPALVDTWARWVRDRLDESLPMSVPLQEVDAADLASLVTGALGESLRASGPGRRTAPTPPTAQESTGVSEHLPLTLGRRAVFLLRSAGFVAPDPPSLNRS